MIAKNPLTCGFFKVKVYELMLRDCKILGKNDCDTKGKSEVFMEHCREIKEFFIEGRFDFDENQYKTIGPVISDIFKLLTRNAAEKKRVILRNFNRESWEKLALEERRKHSLFDCKGCRGNQNFKHGLSMFPIPNFYKNIAQNPGLIRKPLQDISNISPAVAQKQRENKIKRDLVKEIEKIKESTAVAR